MRFAQEEYTHQNQFYFIFLRGGGRNIHIVFCLLQTLLNWQHQSKIFFSFFFSLYCLMIEILVCMSGKTTKYDGGHNETFLRFMLEGDRKFGQIYMGIIAKRVIEILVFWFQFSEKSHIFEGRVLKVIVFHYET